MSLAMFRRCGGPVTLAAVLAARSVLAQSCLCGTAADEFVAARAGLEREWVVQVPFDSVGWRLDHVVVGESLVVAQAGDGTVAAIVAARAAGAPRPGTIAWSQQIGSAPAPVERAGIGDKLVAVARGRGLTAFDARTGELLWERPLRTIVSAGPVSSDGWVYVPLDAGDFVRFPENPRAAEASATNAAGRADSKAQARAKAAFEPKEITTDGEVDFPMLPFEGGALWCSDDGRIAALVRLGKTWERLEFDLGVPASGPPVVYDGDIFVATLAGDVARLARSPQGLIANSGVMQGEDGKEIPFTGWHTIIDAVPEGEPVVGVDAVVLSLGTSGMVAFATATGDLLWRVPAAGRPLAVTGDRVWCIEETGFLVARDLASGARRGRLCLGCFTLPIVNTTTQRLILASPKGLVVSLAARRTVAAEPPVPPAGSPEHPAADREVGAGGAPPGEDAGEPPADTEPTEDL